MTLRVALAIDADNPCGPTDHNCEARVNKFRDNPKHGSLRVFAVASTAKTGKEAMAKTTVVFNKPPIEQRHLRPLSDFNRTRPPLYTEPKGSPTPQQPPGAQIAPNAPQAGSQVANSGGSTGSHAGTSTKGSPALGPAKVAIEAQGKIGKLAGQTPNIARVAGLVQGGLAVLGLVQQVASAFKLGSTLKSATEAVDSGDLPHAENELRAVSDDRVQRAAEQMRIHAADILKEGDAIWSNVSLIELTILEEQLETAHDSERLFDLSNAASDFAFEISMPLPSLQSNAHDIRLMAAALHAIAEFCKRAMEFPVPDPLLIKTKIFGLSMSTETAGNKLDNAAKDYEQAGVFAGQLAAGAQAIGHKANIEAWRIVKKNFETFEREAKEKAQKQSPEPPSLPRHSLTSTKDDPSSKDSLTPLPTNAPPKGSSVLDRLTDDMRRRDYEAIRKWREENR